MVHYKENCKLIINIKTILDIFEITLNHSKTSRRLHDITSRHRHRYEKIRVTAAHKHHFHRDAAASQSSRREKKPDARNELSSIRYQRYNVRVRVLSARVSTRQSPRSARCG